MVLRSRGLYWGPRIDHQVLTTFSGVSGCSMGSQNLHLGPGMLAVFLGALPWFWDSRWGPGGSPLFWGSRCSRGVFAGVLGVFAGVLGWSLVSRGLRRCLRFLTAVLGCSLGSWGFCWGPGVLAGVLGALLRSWGLH